MNFYDKNKRSSVAMAVLSALALSACGGSDNDTPEVEVPLLLTAHRQILC